MKTYDPQFYATTIDKRYQIVRLVLEKYGGRLNWRGGERVLDIGSGVGDITRRCILPLLPRDFKSLLLSDLSMEMLEMAKSEFLGIEHVDFLQLDIGKSFDDNLRGSFDKIFSTLCFMYIADQRKAFENVFQLLAPGGDCFILLTAKGAFYETTFQLLKTPKWKDKLKRCREVFVYPYHEDPNPVKTVEEHLKYVGFSNIFVKKENFIRTCATAENFKEIMKSVPDFPNDLTNEEKLDLLDDQVKIAVSLNVIEEFLDESKPVTPFENLIIHAKRS